MEVQQTLDWNKINTGFSRIIPERFLKFDVDTSGKKTVYISLITEDGTVIADALPKGSDVSVIIGTDCHLYDAKPGQKWVDVSGHSHLGSLREKV